MNKRLVIFMTYNKKGIVDDYIVYMLKQLCCVADDVYVVSNKKYTEGQRKKLSFVSKCIERDNEKYDVGAYSYVIEKLYDTKKIYEYDELILINDSVFGPFYDLKDMFNEMDQRIELDFWGLTKRGISNFDGGCGVYPEHIQSYFYAFRKKIICSDEFKKYWKFIVDYISDFRSAIVNYEFKLTHYFSEKGFKWGTYCDCDEFISNNMDNNLSPYHYSSYELIAKKKCPFLKRKLFTGDFINKEYTDASDLKKTYKYIQDNTNYDVDLMWKYILREYNIASVMDALQMIEVVKNSSNVVDEYAAEYNDGLLFFMKTDGQDIPYIEKKVRTDNVIINLCANSSYVKEIEELFRAEPRLGVVIPPMETFGKVSKSFNRHWIDKDVCTRLMEKWNISMSLSENMSAIHEIYGMVCRKDILTIGDEVYHDIVSDETGTALQMIPVLAQKKGYYTKEIINENYVATEITNTYNILSDICGCFRTKEGEKTVNDLKKDLLEEKIINYVLPRKNIYIYGAGRLAYEVLKIAKIYCDVQGVIVSDKNSNLSELDGYKVYEYSEVTKKDIAVIVAVGKKNSKIITENLLKNGINDILEVE